MSYPIRLLVVTKSTGGVASYVRALVKGLDQEKFLITVACLSENSKEFSAELSQNYGVQSFCLEMNRYQVNPVTDLRVMFKLFAHIRKNRYDLIHAHASKPGFLTRMAAVWTSIPVLYSPHNFAFHEGTKPYIALVVALLERLAALFTTRIIVVSEHERELALQYKVGNPSLYSVVRTGIELDRFKLDVDKDAVKQSIGISSDSMVVGVVGRLASPKAPLVFLRVAEKVHKMLPNVHFVWVGSGPLLVEAERFTADLDLKEVVHWLGERTDVPSLLRVFNCLVLPSRWEGFPLVVLEAFASEVPVVATENLGTREIIETGLNGWLSPFEEIDTMSEQILDMLLDLSKAKKICESGKKQVEEVFTFEKMISSIEEIYRTEALDVVETGLYSKAGEDTLN